MTLNGAFTAIASFSLCVCAAAGDEQKALPAGKPVDGLQVRLHLPRAEKGEKPPRHFQVTIENAGDRDLNVKLGFSLNNGRSHYPGALKLNVHKAGEKPRTFDYTNHMGGVAGRVDPFVVPLPAGASYTLRCSFDDFVDPHTLIPIDLKAKYKFIAAELVGEAITEDEVNLDTKGIALIPAWEGKARSNEVPLPSSE
jgi:hypothetical protein